MIAVAPIYTPLYYLGNKARRPPNQASRMLKNAISFTKTKSSLRGKPFQQPWRGLLCSIIISQCRRDMVIQRTNQEIHHMDHFGVHRV